MTARASLHERMLRWLVGPPRDPMAPETRQHITLVAFLAWVGLGADGLSSSAYGPEEAFKALGTHTELALFLAIATAVTVFVIAVSYNQVIELFPTGGGGYKVATRLLGPRTGLVSGVALVIDYVLTIAISIAAGVDALFSFLPESWDILKLEVAALLLVLLVVLNLRGAKESIKILLPVFIGFVATHAFLIVYGIGRHAEDITALWPTSVAEASQLSAETGWLFVVALFIRAYGIGGGTYTGIEAVSNSVNLLREPRVRTGKWTMFYMAGIAGVHGRRHHPAVPAVGCPPGRGADPERGGVRRGAGRLAVVWLRYRALVAGHRPAVRDRSAVRGRQHRFSGRAHHARQHGDRSLGAAPLRRTVGSPGDQERHYADGPRGAGGAAVEPWRS